MKTIVWFGLVLCALRAVGKVIISNPGQKVTIECGIEPFNDYVGWHHGTEIIFSSPKRRGTPRKGKSDIVSRSRQSGEKNLQITNLKVEDAGKFTCEVDHKRQEHTLLVVSVSALPSSVLQVGNEARLLCRCGDLNSNMEWKGPNGQTHTDIASLKPVALSDAGTWECKITHEEGVHTESLVITVKDPKVATPAPTQGPGGDRKSTPTKVSDPNNVPLSPFDPALLLGLSWWVWVAIGVGSLIVLLLVGFVTVLYNRIKRRRRRYRDMKNCRLPLQPKQYCKCERPAAAAKPQQGRRRDKPTPPPLQAPLV
ncbi:hypothetical protein PBY51_017251 [Eleginops maclovinus]|uniref:Ig-like domain-containing protein n=1 Tax=Eleginops maclovinus TaxID=56733 RepID=A0AAN7XLB5_ELEMC|nr:hypothetical protein PBY51_017251 [Eleginops maclovinus]